MKRAPHHVGVDGFCNDCGVSTGIRGTVEGVEVVGPGECPGEPVRSRDPHAPATRRIIDQANSPGYQAAVDQVLARHTVTPRCAVHGGRAPCCPDPASMTHALSCSPDCPTCGPGARMGITAAASMQAEAMDLVQAARVADVEQQEGPTPRALALALLDLANVSGMPDSYWLTDHRIALACEALGITPVEARERML